MENNEARNGDALQAINILLLVFFLNLSEVLEVSFL